MNNRLPEESGAGFDLGTSPHGLPADLPFPDQETSEVLSDRPSAKLVCGLGSGVPMAYRTEQVRSACRAIRAAFAKRPHEVHYLRLTDREFLHAYSAVEHDRSRMRKAIGKGIADIQDLRATDSLWDALQCVMTRRLKKAWRL